MGQTINISDHPILGLKRKVTWNAFIYSEKESIVKLFTIVSHYKNISGSYDTVPYISNAVGSYEKILTASNNKMVNPVNGLICQSVTTPDTIDADGNTIPGTTTWTDAAGNNVISPMGEFSFYQLLIQNPINIPVVISQIIQQEDVYYHSFD